MNEKDVEKDWNALMIVYSKIVFFLFQIGMRARKEGVPLDKAGITILLLFALNAISSPVLQT